MFSLTEQMLTQTKTHVTKYDVLTDGNEMFTVIPLVFRMTAV